MGLAGTRRVLKYGGIFLILWISAQTFSWVNFTVPLRHYAPPRESVLPPPRPGVQRILIFSPHEDDETLATGGTIYTELNEGNQVLVVFMTNGDGFWGAESLVEVDFLRRAREFLDFAHKRQREAIQRKLAALRVYRTQQLVMGRFLSSFVRTNELYCRLQVPLGGSR